MALDGAVVDLAQPIEKDAKIEFINREDPRALELIRHDAAHVLAKRCSRLWPGTQVTIGPVIDNGFYYDFFYERPFTPEDLPAIEEKMRKIVKASDAVFRSVRSRDEAKRVFRDKGENYKAELIESIPADQNITLQAGRFHRPLPRPAHDVDRQGRARSS